MQKFQAFAQPWWVNLLIIVPVATYLLLRRKNIRLAWHQLILITIFAAAFGFVEASVVVYLRATIGLLPASNTASLAELRRVSVDYQQMRTLAQFPPGLLSLEVLREAATMVMLISVAFLAASKTCERWASFLWAFAVWDTVYYAGLWAVVGWPRSFKDLDVLFLIPVPWLAQVWYPLLVSLLTLLAVTFANQQRMRTAQTSAGDD